MHGPDEQDSPFSGDEPRAAERWSRSARAGNRIVRAIPRGLGLGLLWLLIFILLGLGLLRGMGDPRALEQLWQEARLAPLLLAFALLCGGLLFMGLRWRELLPAPRRIGRAGIVAICATGQLLNQALPGPVGELAAAGLVQRRYGIEAPVALAAGVHSRFIGVGTAALVAFLTWLLVPMPIPEDGRYLVLAALALVIGGGLFLGLVAIWPVLLSKATSATVGRMARLPLGPVVPLLQRLEAMMQSFAQALAGQGRALGLPHLKAVGWALVGILSVAAGTWVAAWALGRPGDLAGFVFTHCAVTAGAVILFALPVGQLGWDAAFAALLVTTVGLPLEHGLAVTALVRVQQLAVVSLGALALGWFLERGRGSAEQVPAIRQESSTDPGGAG